MKRIAMIGVVLITAAACGGNGDDTNKGMTVDEACAKVTEEIARRSVACEKGPSEALPFMKVATSRTCFELSAAVAAGRVKYDASKVQTCIDSIASAGCGFLENTTECDAAVAGLVQGGGACAADSECAGEAFCKLPEQVCALGVCTAAAKAGEACAEAECAKGTACVSSTQKCAPVVGVGVKCGPDAVCSSGLFCDSTTQTCTARKQAGGTCARSSQCEPGLWCKNGSCVATQALGQSCGPDAACVTYTTCEDGKCTLWGKIGETCGFVSGGIKACIEGRCEVPSGSTKGTCAALANEGGTCNSTFDCVPGLECDEVQEKCVKC